MSGEVERIAARPSERTAAVSFMREIAGPLPKGVLNGEVWILHRVADAIERGDHLKEQQQ